MGHIGNERVDLPTSPFVGASAFWVYQFDNILIIFFQELDGAWKINPQILNFLVIKYSKSKLPLLKLKLLGLILLDEILEVHCLLFVDSLLL